MLFDSWLWILIALAWWVPQNAQHEGAHALAHRSAGGEILSFTVYPTDKSGELSFRFWEPGFAWARMRAKHYAPLSPSERALASIAPQLANTMILLLLLLWGIGTGWWSFVLTGLYVNNYVDGTVNLGTYYLPEPEDSRKSSDGWKLQKTLGLSPWLCRVGAAVWHVGFAVPLVFDVF